MMNLVAHKAAVVRRALDGVEPDTDSESKAFMADVMGGVLAQAEQEIDQATRRIQAEADPDPGNSSSTSLPSEAGRGKPAGDSARREKLCKRLLQLAHGFEL